MRFGLFYDNSVLRLLRQVFDTYPIANAGQPRRAAQSCFNELTVLRCVLNVVDIAVINASVVVQGFILFDTRNDSVSLNAVLFTMNIAAMIIAAMNIPPAT